MRRLGRILLHARVIFRLIQMRQLDGISALKIQWRGGFLLLRNMGLALNLLIKRAAGDANMIMMGNRLTAGTLQMKSMTPSMRPLPTGAEAGAQGAWVGRPVQHYHSDSNPLLYVGVVIICLAFCVGWMVLTPTLEHVTKKERAPAKNVPMIQIGR